VTVLDILTKAKSATAGVIDETMLFGGFYRRLVGGGGEENTASYRNGRRVAFVATFFVPGGVEVKGAETALVKTTQIGVHAAEQMAERKISEAMVKAVIRNGERFYDPLNKSINYVVRRGFASGKDLLVATNPFTGMVTTVIRGRKLVRPRFVPLK
jgi:Domain of unknown function (DUF4258)